jgi:hypothetical protein
VPKEVPRMSLGGVFQVSASSHRVRSPHGRMSPLNPWTWEWGVNCSTERMSPLVSVGWRGREDCKGRVHWGWDGMNSTLV